MHRSLALTAFAAVLVARLATADPAVEVRYYDGVPQIHLTGSYPQATYTVYRAGAATGPWIAFTDFGTLCLGPCYGEDREAEPGSTYWYRFDIVLNDGSFASYGPYEVTISAERGRRVGARIVPNPSRAASRVEVFIAGAPTDSRVEASAVLFDLQGRAVRSIFRGTLPRGVTSIAWDGRSDTGGVVPAGQYFLRIATPLGGSTTRVLRVN